MSAWALSEGDAMAFHYGVLELNCAAAGLVSVLITGAVRRSAFGDRIFLYLNEFLFQVL